MSLENILVVVAVLLLLSIFASKASGRLGVPALIPFLVLGMLAGSEGIGGIYFDDAELAQRVGVVALAFILFAAGLETDWKFVRGSVGSALSLSTVGVLLTSVAVGWFAHRVAGFSLLQGMLLGAIVSATDAAAVFSILRSSGVSLRQHVTAVLELESGSNDPMAVFLTTALLQLLVNSSAAYGFLVFDFVKQMAFGAAAGIFIGFAAVRVLNRTRLDYPGLYSVMTIAIVLFTYGATNLIGGSGFLAVYLAGIVMGNRNFIQRRTLTRFHDGVAWLMQIAMFLTLGLLVFPSHLAPVAGTSLTIAAFLIFVARPLAVFASLSFSRMSIRDKVFISWVGLRGAVPIVLATFPLLAGIPMAPAIFNIVFFIVLASVMIQGTTIAPIARLLRVTVPTVTDWSPAEAHLASRGESALLTLQVEEDSAAAHRRVVELGWPRETLILVVYRGKEFFVPNGATELKANDRLIVLTSKESVESLQASVTARRSPTACCS